MDIGFVILQYKAIKSTKKAVDSILKKCDAKSFAVIIVDNASPDRSGTDILNYYKFIDNVYVLLNDTNLGFSAGNNIGFSYAKYQLKCRYIVLMNNDVNISSSNFFEIIEEDFAQYGYGVLGPKIHDKYLKSIRSNPVEKDNYSLKKLYIERFDCQLYLFLRYFKMEEAWIKFREILSKVRNISGVKKVVDFHEKVQLNIVLHGCILIFSPKYVEKFDGLKEVTFMYHEEEILFNEMKRYGMLMMYEPRIEVCHEHMASTSMQGKTKKESRILQYKIRLQSTKDLIAKIKNES